MKRFAVLFAAVLLAGALVGLAARVWRPAPPAAEAPAARPESDLAIEIGPDGVSPATASVPKDHVVRLAVTNRTPHPVALSLAGYEDRVHAGPIAAGGAWSGTFVADRPGEGFAWIVDGVSMGRLEVAGSHLVEGHR